MSNIKLLQKIVQDMKEGRTGNTRANLAAIMSSAIPLFEDFIAIHPELQHSTCRCGREFSFIKIHCPYCGRGPLYPLARKVMEVLPDGTEVQATKYRCRGCSKIYTDVKAFFSCNAPSLPEPASERKAREQVKKITGLTSEDLVQGMVQLRKDQGRDLGILEEFDTQPKVEKEPEPGTPEWYEAHPEES
jgi:hypothetical protein